MYHISDEKFWISRKENGFVVGSGDHELTRDDLPYGTARLIAAAPDLLDALKRVMRHVPADAGGASLGDDMYRARLAIARATGGK
jgi:hypothetical protein